MVEAAVSYQCDVTSQSIRAVSNDTAIVISVCSIIGHTTKVKGQIWVTIIIIIPHASYIVHNERTKKWIEINMHNNIYTFNIWSAN